MSNITVKGLPSSWRSPGVYIANVARNSGSTIGNQPTMLIGQMLSAGTATANTPVLCYTQSQVNSLIWFRKYVSSNVCCLCTK